MYKWLPLQHASCALPLRFVFPVWKWGAKMPKNTANLFVNNLRTFRKFTVSSISHLDLGDIKEVWHKDWKMSLYIPGQVRAGFCWITKKSKIIQLKIFFTRIIFVWTFFKDANFVIFSADFLIVKFERIS